MSQEVSSPQRHRDSIFRESRAQLKSYFGWAPRREQTGVSFDRTRLDKGGSREMKKAMFLIVLTAIRRKETEWAKLYDRLFGGGAFSQSRNSHLRAFHLS